MPYMPSPAALPRPLLGDPHLLAALRARDFGVVFAAANRAGLSYNRIAEACSMKAERVSQVARGASEVKTLDAIERISDGLRIPGVLMGLAARPWEGTDHSAHPHAQDGVDPMKRRDLLRGALAAGLTSAALATLEQPAMPLTSN
ncbi:hypothetical protein [Peterkaempfera bronchialis]|uniref:hypothetical protein n=1 Tax=Peterkaempfera bronchialis TaxID=2126346 RepID=UPI003C2F7B11